METRFTFLTREGAIEVVFQPALTPPQYDELYVMVKAEHVEGTKRELRIALGRMADRWGVALESRDTI